MPAETFSGPSEHRGPGGRTPGDNIPPTPLARGGSAGGVVAMLPLRQWRPFVTFMKFKSIRMRGLAATAVTAGAVAASLSLTGASAGPVNSVAAVAGSGHAFGFGFRLVASPG